jgi:hypothetical protein
VGGKTGAVAVGIAVGGTLVAVAMTGVGVLAGMLVVVGKEVVAARVVLVVSGTKVTLSIVGLGGSVVVAIITVVAVGKLIVAVAALLGGKVLVASPQATNKLRLSKPTKKRTKPGQKRG